MPSKVMVLEGLGDPATPSWEACQIYLKSKGKAAARATGRAMARGAKAAARAASHAAGKGIHHLARKISQKTERYGDLGSPRKLTPAQQRFKQAAKDCRGRVGRGGNNRSYLACMRQELKK